MVSLRVVANSVAIRNKGPKTHHTVRIGRHLIKQKQHKIINRKNNSLESLAYDFVKTFIT